MRSTATKLHRNRLHAFLLLTTVLVMLSAPGSALAAEEPVTLRWFFWQGGSTLATVEEIFRDFSALHNGRIQVQIDLIPGGREGAEQIVTQTVGGLAPDIGVLNGVWAPDLLEDLALPLDPYIERDNFDLSRFVPASIGPATMRNGIRYSLPYTFEMRYLAMNLSMIDAVGHPEPMRGWTLDEFLGLSRALTKDTNGDGNPDVWGIMAGILWRDPFIGLFGGNYVDPATGEFTMNQEPFLQGMELYDDIVNKSRIGVAGVNVNDWWAQKAGMAVLYSSIITTWYLQNHYQNFEMKAGHLPAVNGQTTSWFASHNLIIHMDSAHKEEAWELMKYWFSPEAQHRLGAINLDPPTRDGLLGKRDTVLPPGRSPDRTIEALIDFGERIDGLPMHVPGFDRALTEVIQPAFALVERGERSPRSVVDEIQERVIQILEEAKR